MIKQQETLKMIEQKEIQELVKQIMAEKIHGKPATQPSEKTPVAEAVSAISQTALLESYGLTESEFDNLIINEGIGATLSKIGYTVGGGAFGAAFGGLAGLGIFGVLMMVNPAVGLTGVVASSAIGAWVYASKGRKYAIEKDMADYTVTTIKLAEVTKKRDEVLKKIEKDPENTQLQKQFDSMTKEQMSLGRRLSEQTNYAVKNKTMGYDEKRELDKLSTPAMQGKLTAEQV